jgi:hypothetical protein
MMVQVQQQLASVLPQKVRVATLFQYPTIASLAQQIGEAPGREKAQSRAARQRAARQREALSRRPTPHLAAGVA